MIEAMKKRTPSKVIEKPYSQIGPTDIIITRLHEVISYDEKGRMITEYKKEKINISKAMNETKKIVMANVAEKKLSEIEKIFTTK